MNKYRIAGGILTASLVMSACGGNSASEDTSESEDVNELVEENASSNEEDSTEVTNEDESTDTADGGGDTDTPEVDEIVEESSDNTPEEDTAEATNEDESTDTSDGGGDTDTPDVDEIVEENPGSTSDTIMPDDLEHKASEAVTAASEKFDGALKTLELDNEDDQWVYQVEMESETEEYEATLSAEDLSFINEERENDDGFDTEEHFNYDNAVAAEEAAQTAIDETGEGLEGWTLSIEDGQLEYEMDMADTDMTINAETGEVTEMDD
ncbi:hypothetical protein GQ671_10860 [Salinicoccus hispanicus]|uniref:PepSY domain-containing protein n=2 Tax=Salinicoccus hispanicus TaxID=157225 RepID=A0A6N8U119_9STAP|nr:PepSY domain-containing protein [Salinicoccus hispanicus]MXQ51764.1 hypothetical protein [Salinicoccus hispanicus]